MQNKNKNILVKSVIVIRSKSQNNECPVLNLYLKWVITLCGLFKLYNEFQSEVGMIPCENKNIFVKSVVICRSKSQYSECPVLNLFFKWVII